MLQSRMLQQDEQQIKKYIFPTSLEAMLSNTLLAQVSVQSKTQPSLVSQALRLSVC